MRTGGPLWMWVGTPYAWSASLDRKNRRWWRSSSKPLPLLPGCSHSVSSGLMPSGSALPTLMECMCPDYEPVLLLRHLATAARQWLVQRLTNSAKTKQQIVSKQWRNWRARVPWAGTQNYADAMVNRIEITHKTENRITCGLTVSCLGMQTKGWRVKSWRDTHTYSCSIHNSKNK